MPSTIMTTPVDDASSALSAARTDLAALRATSDRITARLAAVTAEVSDAERASVAAATIAAPNDDADAMRRLSEARQRLDVTEKAIRQNEDDIAHAEHAVTLRTTELAKALAEDELAQAIALVPEFQAALQGLVDSVAAIEQHIATARRHVNAVGQPLHAPIVIGRRIRHVLAVGAKITLDDGPSVGYDAPSAAAAVRGALENPRWSN